MGRTALALAVVLLSTAASAAPGKLLSLAPVAEGVDAARTAQVQAGLEAALASIPSLERVPGAGPTFCSPADVSCIAAAGRSAGASRVLYTVVRPVGETLSVLLLLVPADGGTPKRLTEGVPAGAKIEPAVHAAAVRLVAPERWSGSILVEASDGSELWVDGAKVGVTPLSSPVGGLAPGQHMLRVVRPGGAEARSYVEIRYGAVTRVRIEPRTDDVVIAGFDVGGSAGSAAAASGTGAAGSSAADSNAASASAAGAEDAPARGEPAPMAATARASDEPGLGPGWRVARWTLLGVGAALVVGGFFPAVSADDARAEEAALRNADGTVPSGSLARQQELADEISSGETLSTTLWTAGGLCLAGSAAIFVVDALGAEDDEGGGSDGVRLGFSATGDGAGLVLSVRR